MQEMWVRSLGWEDPLEKEMATHSSILAWEVSWTEEPDGLPSMRLQKVRHNLATEQQQGKDSKGLCPSILGNIFMLAFITSQSFFPLFCFCNCCKVR